MDARSLLKRRMGDEPPIDRASVGGKRTARSAPGEREV